jgi:hypothetical protein
MTRPAYFRDKRSSLALMICLDIPYMVVNILQCLYGSATTISYEHVKSPVKYYLHISFSSAFLRYRITQLIDTQNYYTEHSNATNETPSINDT